MFTLHPKVAEDTLYLGNFLLSRVLLMNNARFPWLILVPEREFVVEITDLSASGRVMLMEESVAVINVLQKLYKPDKINMAALGNISPQFHMHIVGRYKTDEVWPDPVWGIAKLPIRYTREEQAKIIPALLQEFSLLPHFTIQA
jgi:diadenosine tetraphosphate (Ap4A) HIT family hydrolase